MEEILKGLGIEDEVIKNIIKGMKDNKIFITKEEKIEERYNKLKLEKEDLKEKLGNADKTIEELKKSNKDNEALQATIKAHEETIKTIKTEYQEKVRNMSIQNAIQSKLTDTKYADLLESKFDKDKLIVNEDGTVTGIDEQLKAIKDTYKELFSPVVAGKEPGKGSSSGSLTITKEQFNSMSYKERVELYNSDQELYNALTQEA